MKARKVDVTARYFLRLVHGEDLRSTLTKFLEENNIQSAVFHGLGAFNSLELAYFSMKEKKYISKTFDEGLEVGSIIGNVALLHGKPFLHMHTAVGRHDYSSAVGHIIEAEVGPTMEIYLEVFKEPVHRVKDDLTTLDLCDLEDCTFAH